MLINVLKSKIHRVIVTETSLSYEGSCAIDPELMEAANIKEYEQLHIYNTNNGERFTTYAIKGESDTGMISVRGAAARLCQVNDILIICTYAMVDSESNIQPIKVYVNEENKSVAIGSVSVK